jgi:hypothetical protein
MTLLWRYYASADNPMTKPKNSQSDSKKDNRDVLLDHIRWMVVLAKLKELDPDSTEKPDPSIRSIQNINNDKKLISFAPLFTDEDSAFKITLEQWQSLFCKSVGAKDKRVDSYINTIYQCRNFYALDAPNNPAQRLTKIVDGTGRATDGKYDENIKQWGNYGKQLVAANGGWEKFLKLSQLSAIKDVKSTLIGEITGDNRESLIQRILYLERDRYIQVITTTVGALWPIWFLKITENIDVLKNITEREQKTKDFRVGKRLPTQKLYIDINPFIGKMRGLPYPFGFTDTLLEEALQDKGENIQALDQENWPATAVNLLIKKLREQYWSPPILFPVRSDTLPVPEDEKENYSIPFVMVAEGCDTFASVYIKVTSEHKKLDELKFGIEKQTYGEIVVKKLGIPEDRVQRSLRRDSVSLHDTESLDIILSYSPVNVLLGTNKKFKKLSNYEIYTKYKEQGKHLIYSSPSVYLAGGMFLARQPKGINLVIDLVTYLQKIILILNHIKPDWDDIDPAITEVLNSQDSGYKTEQAEDVNKTCIAIARKSKLYQDDITKADTLFQRLSAIGEDMAEYLIYGDDAESIKLRQEIKDHFKDWAWVLILESAKYSSIYVSSELFGGVK